MHRALSLAVASCLALGALSVLSSTTSAIGREPGPGIDTGCATPVDLRTGTCTAELTLPGAGDRSGAHGSDRHGEDPASIPADVETSTDSSDDDDGKPACVRTDGNKPRAVPCASTHGIWQADAECYASATPSDPQPPQSSAVWQHFDENFGVGEEQGTVYDCYYPSTGQTALIYLFDPPSAAQAPPTPGEVARESAGKAGPAGGRDRDGAAAAGHGGGRGTCLVVGRPAVRGDVRPGLGVGDRARRDRHGHGQGDRRRLGPG